MTNRSRFLFVTIAAAVSLGAVRADSLKAQDSVTVVAGPDYESGRLNRWLFGSSYRDLWTTPITVPYLDVTGYAGGLTPVRTGGFGQTTSLHFNGADGVRYVFRSIDKDLSRRLADELKGTFAEDIIQDQTSAYNPVAALITSPLVEAAGVLAAKPEIYVMPDDPALGEYREAYAGMLGLMMENPDEGEDNTEGFAGSRRVSGSDAMLRSVENRIDTRVDAVGFLKARLLDIYLGDRDRHKGQWKWARFDTPEGGRIWEVVAEDRDQPFVKQDGLILGIVRSFFVRKLTNFSADYTNMPGLTWNGWDLDRRFLAGLERSVWDSVAVDLQRRLTDEVIEDALSRFPPPYMELRGDELRHELRTRRDNLHLAATEYYEFLAGWVDVHGTDEAEVAEIDRNDDGSMDVILRRVGDAAAEPHFRRHFISSETGEVRIHLHGGADSAVVRGDNGAMNVRVVGGGGADVLIDQSHARTNFYDGGGRTTVVRGRRTSYDGRDYTAPPSPDFAHEAPPDFERWLRVIPGFSFAPDIGLYVGATVDQLRYGFRRFPFSSRIGVVAGFSFGTNQPTVGVSYQKRQALRNIHIGFDAIVSSLHLVRFHGFGNETTISGPSDFYETRLTQSSFAVPWLFDLAEGVEFGLSPVGKITVSDADDITRLAADAPYGIGTFGQAGLNAHLSIDRRDRPVAASKGFYLRGEGAYYPSIFDVVESFGRIEGEASTYLSAGPATLALRGGGAKVWGMFPFHEAAYLGGATTLRGFSENRFAGDAAVYGNAELRVRLTTVRIIFPLGFGVHGLGDVGRVWSDLDPSGTDDLHTAVGGGIWFSLMGPANTLSFSVANSDENTSLYINAGFMF